MHSYQQVTLYAPMVATFLVIILIAKKSHPPTDRIQDLSTHASYIFANMFVSFLLISLFYYKNPELAHDQKSLWIFLLLLFLGVTASQRFSSLLYINANDILNSSIAFNIRTHSSFFSDFFSSFYYSDCSVLFILNFL